MKSNTNLENFLVQSKLVASVSEVKRMIDQRAVTVHFMTPAICTPNAGNFMLYEGDVVMIDVANCETVSVEVK